MMDDLLKQPQELVDCWDDEQRMDFLYSAFPESIESNPEHWKSKSLFWIELVTKLCRHSTCVCIDYSTVARWVGWKGRAPLGLDTVWDIMIKEGILVAASDYLGDITRNASWLGWGMNNFVRKPTLWIAWKVLDPLKNLSPVKSNEKKKKYICLKVLLEKSDMLLQLLRASPAYTHGQTRIIPLVELCRLAQDIARDKQEIEMLLLNLSKDKKVVVFNRSDDVDSDKFVKFSSSHAAVNPVDERDHGLVRLEEAKKQLEEQISNSYKQQASLEKSARELVKSGDRSRALNILKQKRRSLMNIKSKEASLDNIHQLLLRLEQSSTDHTVMEAYKAGVSAYKESTKVNDLSYEAVEAVMDDVGSVIDHHEDITSIMSTSITEANISVDDIEKELNDLLSDQNEEIISNQTDADIAKLISGMNSLNTSTTAPKQIEFPPIVKSNISPRKKLFKPLT